MREEIDDQGPILAWWWQIFLVDGNVFGCYRIWTEL